MEEEFKIIKGFANYSVSNYGNVRNDSTGRILKPGITTGGYYFIFLSKDGKNKLKTIHRLVGEAFIPNPEYKRCLDHIDSNRLNNNLSNLRWATHQENSYNTKISKANTSGTKGIYWHKKLNKWMAYISINGKLKNLGYFEKKEDAIKARVLKANEIYGEFKNTCEEIKQEIAEIKDDKQIELDEIEALERELDELIKRK